MEVMATTQSEINDLIYGLIRGETAADDRVYWVAVTGDAVAYPCVILTCIESEDQRTLGDRYSRRYVYRVAAYTSGNGSHTACGAILDEVDAILNDHADNAIMYLRRSGTYGPIARNERETLEYSAYAEYDVWTIE